MLVPDMVCAAAICALCDAVGASVEGDAADGAVDGAALERCAVDGSAVGAAELDEPIGVAVGFADGCVAGGLLGCVVGVIEGPAVGASEGVPEDGAAVVGSAVGKLDPVMTTEQ